MTPKNDPGRATRRPSPKLVLPNRRRARIARRRVRRGEGEAIDGTRARLDSLGAELLRVADLARGTAKPDTEYLSEPIGGCDSLGDCDRFFPVCTWGIFHPFGPSALGLCFLEVPGTGERLLYFRRLHPFFPKGFVFGLLPRGAFEERDRVVRMLRALFAKNGCAELPLLISMPSSVRLDPDAPVQEEKVREMFWLAAKRVREDVDLLSDRLEAFPYNPWECAAATVRSIPSGPSGGAPSRISRASFDRWWSLATEPGHVARETSQMPLAWEYAMRMFLESDRDSKAERKSAPTGARGRRPSGGGSVERLV